MSRLWSVAPVVVSLLAIASQSGAELSLLRPGYGTGDPLWNWPSAMDVSIRPQVDRGSKSAAFWGRLSGWHPFRVSDLSLLMWETGLDGRRVGGAISGAFLSGPWAEEFWLDLTLIHRFRRISGWIGGGGGGSQFEGRWRMDALGPTGGLGITSGALAVTSRMALDHSAARGAWSWMWGGEAALRVHSSLHLEARVAQGSTDRGSILLGLIWKPGAPKRRPFASLALGHSPTHGTSLARLRLLMPIPGPALGLWTHVHPVLGWTPGFSMSWGRRE